MIAMIIKREFIEKRIGNIFVKYIFRAKFIFLRAY